MRITAALLLAGITLGSRPEAAAVLQASKQPPIETSAEESQVPSTEPCPDNLGRDEAEPLQPGPARLATIHCLNLPGGRVGRLPPVVSPDGRSVAFWSEGQASPLDVVPLNGAPGLRLFNRVTFRDFGPGLDSRQDALAWRPDSSGIWSVEQQVVRPNGWALSGLTPILIDREGELRRFAPPDHAAGPLDGLAWVGGGGRAVVQFGTRGGYYRPQHRDPSPTLAMVDVPGRRILDTVTAADAEPLRLRTGSFTGFGLFGLSAVQLKNGRLRALLQLERVVDHSSPRAAGSDELRFLPAVWLVWTQGRGLVTLRPFFDDRSARSELTPDASHILAWQALQPEGLIIEHCRKCPAPPPPKPIEAAVAALVDARSGRTIWTVRARASEFWNRFGRPVISPTGRLALIPLPAVDKRQIIALLSMADGRILQRFSLGCTGCYAQSFGFTRGGRQIWVQISNRLVLYNLP